MDSLTLALIAIAGLAALLLVLSVCRVPPGHSYTINRLGHFHRTLQPGVHFITPLVDRVAHRVNMLGQVLELRCQDLETKDHKPVTARGCIYFQILDPRKAADRLGTLEEAAGSLAEAKTREMVSQVTGGTLNRRTAAEINAWLLGLLNQSAAQWGVRVTRIDLQFEELVGEDESEGDDGDPA